MMPSTSQVDDKKEMGVLEEQNPAEISNLEETTEEIEEIIVVSDDQIQEEMIVEGEEIIYDDEEEYGIEYEAISLSNEKNLVFDMYQPHPTENGTFVCKICVRTGKGIEYPDRPSFVAHRYKCHGSFNNNVLCPLDDCRQAYASLYSLRRHLSQQHHLPLEIHLQTFTNIGEFERFRHLVELATGCKYMMHTKQPKYRRQVMHCAKSEHKLVLQTNKHRLPRERMEKEGAACPSVISYRVDPANGTVHAFMQLFHVGHAPDTESSMWNANSARPMDVVFPLKPACWAAHAMQFVQIDVHPMDHAVYGTKVYEGFLIVTCIKTKFMWARPLMELSRTAIGRILNSIFNEYGVPEGFSTAFQPTYIRDTMKSLESVYAVEIREIWNEPLPYHSLEHWILELSQNDLGTRNRWVEQLQFVVMEYNQKHIPERDETPFERMFNRKAPNLYQNGDQLDMAATKCRRFHSELRHEDEGMDEQLSTVFSPGQKVFLRKGITKPRRGNNTPFYFGIVGECDPTNQFYPFKVHFSSTDSPWPTERNMFVWASVFDLLPTVHGISEMTSMEIRESISNYLCSCPGEDSNKNFEMSAIGRPAREASNCLLFRNFLCANAMSKYCCKLIGTENCRFHALYPENDESYQKMDAVLAAYLQENKEIEKRAAKELQERVTLQRMANDEIHRRRHHDDEIIDVHLSPPRLEREQDPVEERIDIETLDEEMLEPAVPLGEPHSNQIEYVGKKEVTDSAQSSPMKRVRRRKSPVEGEKRVKIQEEGREELSPPSASTSSTSDAATTRRPARKSIRPKILEDYVE